MGLTFLNQRSNSFAATRPLDTMLMDDVVADYAKMIYRRQYEDGTLVNDAEKVRKFFSVENVSVARDLLG